MGIKLSDYNIELTERDWEIICNHFEQNMENVVGHESNFKLKQVVPIYTMKGVEEVTVIRRECTYDLDKGNYKIYITYRMINGMVEMEHEEVFESFHNIALKAIKLKEEGKL